MYRVYDLEKQKWVKDKIYLSPLPQSDLYILKKNFLGKDKLVLVENDRYIVHKFIDLYDKDSNMVFEGDIIKAQISDDKTVTGIVSYFTNWSAYVVFCFDPDEFYVLGDEICQYISVIGNVFDTPELVPEVIDEGDTNEV